MDEFEKKGRELKEEISKPNGFIDQAVKIYDWLDWKWAVNSKKYKVPGRKEISETAFRLIDIAIKEKRPCWCSGGGLKVDVSRSELGGLDLEIRFIVLKSTVGDDGEYTTKHRMLIKN
jgi:hypothetical protein